ncbi:hypothetical protein [Streptomyces cinereoruber]|uniref:hypothetical protein n=1 Tax=Streptomyces cinereoruber TaxID=67260 RepID=UPI003629DC68
MGLQLAEGRRDADLTLREAGGEFLDADRGTGGQRLDVDGESDRGQREVLVLREVVADDGVAPRLGGVGVDHARAGAARVKVLGIHRGKASLSGFLMARPLQGG